MTDSEYQVALELLVAITATISDPLIHLDLDAMLARAETARDIGPVLDPTAWRDGHRELERHIQLMRALQPLRAFLMSIMDEDVELDEPCPRCGTSTLRQPCHRCDDGYITDLYEEDPLWYDEDDIEVCDECRGYGNYWWCPRCGLDMHIFQHTSVENT